MPYIALAAWFLFIGRAASTWGFVPRLQRAGALCLGLLAAGCMMVVVTLSSTRIGFGEALFLLPCAAVVAGSSWLFARTSRAR